MAENKMKQVAELLGVEMGVPFKVKGFNYNPCVIKENGLHDKNCELNIVVFMNLLRGIYEIKQPILTEKEKQYLEGVLRPFKDRVNYIYKECTSFFEDNDAFINVSLNRYDDVERYDNITLPYFHKYKMYKGMEEDKEYTLEELGLFEDD